MNAHNEQHDSASPVVKQNLTTQPAAAQEAVGWQWRWLDTDNTWSEWVDGGSRKEIDARIARWKADGEDHRMQVRPLFAAPVTAAPVSVTRDADGEIVMVKQGDTIIASTCHAGGKAHAAPEIDLASLVPSERKKPELMMATWHEVAGWNACVAEIRRRIDASTNGALPALPDDFSESKDWRAGSYAERVEWLMDTVRSQRGHINDLMDSPKGGSEARDAVLTELVEAISAFKGKRGAFMALGAQDARTVRLWSALAKAQAGDADVQP